MSSQVQPSKPVSGEGFGAKTNKWIAAAPKAVDSENALGPEKVRAAWAKMYTAAGVSGEEGQMQLRAAVYLYGLINGTSREGSYKGFMKLANGMSVSASVIVAAVGGTEIRKFFRGNMEESYEALKIMPLADLAPAVVVKAAELGCAADEAFATADWMSNNHRFTPGELRVHNLAFTTSVSRARRARSGQSLEDVERGRLHEMVASQGPEAVAGGSRIDF